MIASLPMYAAPHTSAAEARLWAAIRDNLRDMGQAAPETLTEPPGDLMTHWRDPALTFSQTCGLPYRAHLHDQVELIGTPDYGISDGRPGYYHSVVLARADDPRSGLQDFRGAPFALNDPGSQSGWAALAREHPAVLTGPVHITGSHRASVAAVRRGDAAFAAIDAVTFRLLTAEADMADLRIVYRTNPTPGLPFITARGRDRDALFRATEAAITALSKADRDALGLRGLVAIPPETYRDVPIPPPPALQ